MIVFKNTGDSCIAVRYLISYYKMNKKYEIIFQQI